MVSSLQPAKNRVVAVTMIVAVALIALTAGAVALSMTLTVAQHACCHHEVDASCLTLCAASESGAVLTFVDDQAPRLVTAVADGAPKPAVHAGVRPETGRETSPDASPPLFVLHAAFLI